MQKQAWYRFRSFSISDFFPAEKLAPVLLALGLLLSLILANSGLAATFQRLLGTELGFSGIGLRYSVSVWINDGLMAIFFLLVGLEIKREMRQGELADWRKAALPVFAALGGMLLPALFYSAFNAGKASAGGWAIPMATDIAFALAVIRLLEGRIPSGLITLLAALAIVDDLGAILVIAFFYSSGIQAHYLLFAGPIWLLMLAFNYFGVRRLVFYLLPGLVLWYCMHHSGIHATIAGVLTALAIPLRDKKGGSPLQILEHQLVKPVNYIIMPLFALANTHLRFETALFENFDFSLGLGIIGGLFIGKTLGVSLFSWLAVRLGLARLPEQVHGKQLIGLGMLAGIGFTMSIFISLLSFTQSDAISTAKFAILTASLLSGISGYLFLRKQRSDRPGAR